MPGARRNWTKAVDAVRAEPTPNGSVELRDSLVVLRRQLAVIAAVTLLGAGVAAAWSLRRPAVYEATGERPDHGLDGPGRPAPGPLVTVPPGPSGQVPDPASGVGSSSVERCIAKVAASSLECMPSFSRMFW